MIQTDAYLDLLLAAEEGPPSTAGQDGVFPLVLIQAKNQGDYAALVDHVASMEPYLAPWARSGKREAGFVLERPLCAAWMEDPPGVEECLVHVCAEEREPLAGELWEKLH